MRNTSPWLVLAVSLAACSSDSKTTVDMSTPDIAVAQPDLTTAAPDLSEIPTLDLAFSDMISCTPNAFIACSGNNAVYCNATGDAETAFDCGGACTGMTGCGQCTATSCNTTTNQLTTCDTTHGKATTAACVTLQAGGNTSMCANGTTCDQCVGSFVCGDGTNNGTSANTQYSCASGTVGTPVACAFGCDAATGKCADMVPANQAGTHAAEAFTCTGTQSTTLPDVSVGSGHTLVIDTSGSTMKLDGTSIAATFGSAYTPTGSSTSAIVAHVKSFTVTSGGIVNITGSRALALLVDGNVSITGASGAIAAINLAATTTTSGGPGANSTSGTGGNASGNANRGGGGGAGHGTAGGTGGIGNAGAAGSNAAAGVAYGAAEILEAGSSGGTGLGVVQSSSAGYGGGGLQISACGTVTVGTNVLFNASGGAGSGGAAGPGGGVAGQGGGGGGSGGTIIVEGKSFVNDVVSGSLVANGGGGGQGGTSSSAGAAGGTWVTTNPITTPAVGGSAGNSGANDNGGAGGAGTTAPAAGQTSGASGIAGGGGGGATGSVFVNVSPLSTKPTVSSASPAAKLSSTCVSGTTCSYTF